MIQLLSVDCHTLLSSHSANAQAGGWCIESWLSGALVAARPRLVSPLAYCSFDTCYLDESFGNLKRMLAIAAAGYKDSSYLSDSTKAGHAFFIGLLLFLCLTCHDMLSFGVDLAQGLSNHFDDRGVIDVAEYAGMLAVDKVRNRYNYFIVTFTGHFLESFNCLVHRLFSFASYKMNYSIQFQECNREFCQNEV